MARTTALPSTVDALQAMVVAQQAELEAKQSTISETWGWLSAYVVLVVPGPIRLDPSRRSRVVERGP